ncbi:predicted protein [Botrytis cinerea T4]|uniref:Uncharacterized protein n=1 Tax=Botryotinia fuckeliana (strain T4) TaxID=999810 RepID=G2YJW3_BOTF4|nr:predicted protein [Botrytis cinerea T4]
MDVSNRQTKQTLRPYAYGESLRQPAWSSSCDIARKERSTGTTGFTSPPANSDVHENREEQFAIFHAMPTKYVVFNFPATMYPLPANSLQVDSRDSTLEKKKKDGVTDHEYAYEVSTAQHSTAQQTNPQARNPSFPPPPPKSKIQEVTKQAAVSTDSQASRTPPRRNAQITHEQSISFYVTRCQSLLHIISWRVWKLVLKLKLKLVVLPTAGEMAPIELNRTEPTK